MNWRDLILFHCKLGGHIDHLLNCLRSEERIVLDMTQCVMALFAYNIGNCLMEHFGFKHLSSVATFFSHVAVSLHPLVEPLLHH
jgi:hypothetical protein